MWKITNELNKQTLNKYHLFISDFFSLLIEISKNKNKINLLQTNDFIINSFQKSQKLDKKLLNINRNSNDKIIPLIKEIILLDSKILIKEFKIFNKQNLEISKQNYNLSPKIHPESLTKLFKDYFYDKFFGVGWIWTEIIGIPYTRETFKTNFKDENGLYVCPYCDTDTISSTRNSWLEHFLPKSKFPYVSCNIDNLIPSCTSCNVSGSGKGEKHTKPICNQYTTQIGDQLVFEYINDKIKIKKNRKKVIENYIELLNLRNKYQEISVQTRIFSSLKINYNIVLQSKDISEFEEDIFLNFIHDNGKNNGLYFVQKNLLKYIKEIK